MPQAHWSKVNVVLGNGLVPDGIKPFSEPMLTQIYSVTRLRWVESFLTHTVYTGSNLLTRFPMSWNTWMKNKGISSAIFHYIHKIIWEQGNCFTIHTADREYGFISFYYFDKGLFPCTKVNGLWTRNNTFHIRPLFDWCRPSTCLSCSWKSISFFPHKVSL